QEDFTSAIGYLVRRLDENTGPDNFLRHAFRIDVGSETWRKLEQQFIASFEAMSSVSADPRRTQNRGRDSFATGEPSMSLPPPVAKESRPPSAFHNEPDTDWSLPHNDQWADS